MSERRLSTVAASKRTGRPSLIASRTSQGDAETGQRRLRDRLDVIGSDTLVDHRFAQAIAFFGKAPMAVTSLAPIRDAFMPVPLDPDSSSSCGFRPARPDRRGRWTRLTVRDSPALPPALSSVASAVVQQGCHHPRSDREIDPFVDRIDGPVGKVDFQRHALVTPGGRLSLIGQIAGNGTASRPRMPRRRWDRRRPPSRL